MTLTKSPMKSTSTCYLMWFLSSNYAEVAMTSALPLSSQGEGVKLYRWFYFKRSLWESMRRPHSYSQIHMVLNPCDCQGDHERQGPKTSQHPTSGDRPLGMQSSCDPPGCSQTPLGWQRERGRHSRYTGAPAEDLGKHWLEACGSVHPRDWDLHRAALPDTPGWEPTQGRLPHLSFWKTGLRGAELSWHRAGARRLTAPSSRER